MMMPQMMGGVGHAAPAVALSTPAEADATPTVEEKTAFDIKLVSFDEKSKIKVSAWRVLLLIRLFQRGLICVPVRRLAQVIKEVRAITGLGLKESKEARPSRAYSRPPSLSSCPRVDLLSTRACALSGAAR